LIFMGEEYGEEAPFSYFVSYSDTNLASSVRLGRKEEFKRFAWEGEVPDPQWVEMFLRSKLHWEKRDRGSHKVLLDFYRTILTLRRKIPAISNPKKEHMKVKGWRELRVISIERWDATHKSHALCLLNFCHEDIHLKAEELCIDGKWNKALDSSAAIWRGPGASLPQTLDLEGSILIRSRGLGVYLRSMH